MDWKFTPFSADAILALLDRIDEQAAEIIALRKQVAELEEIKRRWYAAQADPVSEAEIEAKAWELRIHRGLYLADAYEAAEKWVADRTQRRAEKKKGGS